MGLDYIGTFMLGLAVGWLIGEVQRRRSQSQNASGGGAGEEDPR